MKVLENIKWLEDVFVNRKEENNFEMKDSAYETYITKDKI